MGRPGVRSSAWFIACATLAACEPPPLTVRLRLASGNTQPCISETSGVATGVCEDFPTYPTNCQPVLGIRIVPPDAPEFPYALLCKPLPGRTLCSIAGEDLPQPTVRVPERVLEIQMAVFERSTLATDEFGDPICPRVEFAANGFPVAQESPCEEADAAACPARPALGGRAFYYPGDEETIVTLGCTDLLLLNGQSCRGEELIQVTATVNDFDNPVPVGATLANRLSVSIGEPEDIGIGHALTDTTPLEQTGNAPPAWRTEIGTPFETSFCLEVFEDVPQATRSLLCRNKPQSEQDAIDVTGWYLAKGTLDAILTALFGSATFPAQGLVVGVVLDQVGRPVEGTIVRATCQTTDPPCTIEYLSADRTSLKMDGTSVNGIFLSRDAPYRSHFYRTVQPAEVFGGLVQGKVTIVVLQEAAIGDPL